MKHWILPAMIAAFLLVLFAGGVAVTSVESQFYGGEGGGDGYSGEPPGDQQKNEEPAVKQPAIPVTVEKIVPRPYGYWVWDHIVFSYVFRATKPGVELDLSRIPKAGDSYGEVYVRTVRTQRKDNGDGTYEIRIDFEVQFKGVRDSQQYIEFPLEVFWREGSNAEFQRLTIEEPIRFLYSPLTLPDETVQGEPHGLAPMTENRWPWVWVFGVLGAALLGLGVTLLAKLLLRSWYLQAFSPLAVGARALTEHLENLRRGRAHWDLAFVKAGTAVFRQAIYRKFAISPTSLPEEVYDAFIRNSHWKPYAETAKTLWEKTDFALFNPDWEMPLEPSDFLKEFLVFLKELARHEINEFKTVI